MSSENNIKRFKTSNKALFDLFTFGFNFSDSQMQTVMHFINGKNKTIEIAYIIGDDIFKNKILEVNVSGEFKKNI